MSVHQQDLREEVELVEAREIDDRIFEEAREELPHKDMAPLLASEILACRHIVMHTGVYNPTNLSVLFAEYRCSPLTTVQSKDNAAYASPTVTLSLYSSRPRKS